MISDAGERGEPLSISAPAASLLFVRLRSVIHLFPSGGRAQAPLFYARKGTFPGFFKRRIELGEVKRAAAGLEFPGRNLGHGLAPQGVGSFMVADSRSERGFQCDMAVMEQVLPQQLVGVPSGNRACQTTTAGRCLHPWPAATGPAAGLALRAE